MMFNVWMLRRSYKTTAGTSQGAVGVLPCARFSKPARALFWLLKCIVMATGVLFALLDGFAQENDSMRRPKVVSYPAATDVNQLYIAVMGEIAKPGTYHLDPSTLKLHSTIDRAGGFTSDASKYIRVIRQGRVSQKQLYSESVDSQLFPGDLLIAESKPPMGMTNRTQEFTQDGLTIPANYEERAEPSFVQVALLNVREYPVVLKLRPDDANAKSIVRNLGQPVTLLAEADVITPDRRMTSDAAKQAIRLTEGSVMVFKRDRVDRSRLPSTLPKPIESEIAMGAQIGLIGNPQGQSYELRTLGERVTSSNTNSQEVSPQFSSRINKDVSRPTSPELAPPGEDLRKDFAAPMVRNNPRIATIPFTGSPQISNSSTGSTRSDRATVSSIPEPDDSTNQSTATLPSTAPSESTEIPTITSPEAFSTTNRIILVSIVGILIGASLILRLSLKPVSNQPSSPSATIPAIPTNSISEVIAPAPQSLHQTKSFLERMIKDELPVVIESVEFPEGLALQGRIAARPILRVDGPQSILKQNGPHFESSEHSSSGSSLDDIIAQFDAPETASIRRPHFMKAEKAKVTAPSGTSRYPTEPVADQPVDRSKTPLAKALFELEQGGHS